jgi:hypothetical protein
MKKIVAGVLAVGLLALGLGAGCTIKPENIPVIAQQAGLYSAVGWIALDNPTVDEIKSVKSILGIIEEKAADVTGGATYTQVILPDVIKYIDKNVEAQYRPVCKAGAVSILGGIDLLFATHPEWKEDQDLVIKVVDSFILGAKTGLSMSEDDPAMKAARATSSARARVYKK